MKGYVAGDDKKLATQLRKRNKKERESSASGQLELLGVIVPTGIATDSTTSKFFRNLVETETSTLQEVLGFKNERFLFIF